MSNRVATLIGPPKSVTKRDEACRASFPPFVLFLKNSCFSDFSTLRAVKSSTAWAAKWKRSPSKVCIAGRGALARLQADHSSCNHNHAIMGSDFCLICSASILALPNCAIRNSIVKSGCPCNKSFDIVYFLLAAFANKRSWLKKFFCSTLVCIRHCGQFSSCELLLFTLA